MVWFAAHGLPSAAARAAETGLLPVLSAEPDGRLSEECGELRPAFCGLRHGGCMFCGSLWGVWGVYRRQLYVSEAFSRLKMVEATFPGGSLSPADRYLAKNNLLDASDSDEATWFQVNSYMSLQHLKSSCRFSWDFGWRLFAGRCWAWCVCLSSENAVQARPVPSLRFTNQSPRASDDPFEV